jgi:sec-independent protein translocase protein TatA
MIGTGELILILCVALLLFGGKKLPEFAKNLGKGIREFKRSCSGLDEEELVSKSEAPAQTDDTQHHN